ncbi:MAG: hypothetical protein KA146_09080 [Leptospiraceae bacterium]|jgi:hypothetical protein|nr:hypothetical protein [Leptospiraceae bacterium]
MEKLYEKDGVVVIFWDSSSKALCPEWKSFSVLDKEVKESLEKLLTFIVEKKCDRQIINTGKTLGGFSEQIQDWLAIDWIPRAVKAGMKYVATVTPKNAMAQLSNDYWQEVSTDIGFVTINVTSHEDGVDWLKKFP